MVVLLAAALLVLPARAAVGEAQFEAVLTAVESVYKPVVASRGGILRLRGNWENGMTEAVSRRVEGRWVIDVFGGLARHPATTVDGLAAVVCHEIGHHLGGAPKRASNHLPWASGEGQSDYFAAVKCLRRILPLVPTAEPAAAEPAELRAVATACSAAHPTPETGALCVRSALAGLSFIRLFADFRREPEPSFLVNDVREAPSTDDDYPSAQCRLDTFLSGALCPRPASQEVDDSDHAAGVCSRAGGDAAGWRPACWYRPPLAPAGAIGQTILWSGPPLSSLPVPWRL